MSVDILPELPSYHNVPPSLPPYSCRPTNGEQRLDYTPRPQAVRSRPSGVYVKNSGKMSVVLNDQEENATVPIFGRQAVISGIVLCQERLDSIRKIVLEVEGRLDSSCSAGGDQSITLINNNYTLWSPLTPQEPCLSQIPFSIRLPSTFQDGDNSPALPPSYYMRENGIPILRVRSVYQLHFIVTRIRHHKLDIWPKKQCITIPFKYVPRTRAFRPLLDTPSFFSSVKTSPEEWYQAVTCLNMRPGVEMGPIACHLFVPAGRIYGLKDTINFHIQLSGQRCSLYTLFSGTDLDRVRSVDYDSSVPRKPNNKTSFIHVTLLRQVSVTIRGQDAWDDFILGEGTIWPIPPDLSSCGATCQCSESNIDWDGELRCRSDVTVGGFNAANVQVKDFIILSISPPTSKSPIQEMKVTVPVRLVTDSFSDIVTQMDSTTR